MKLPLEYRPSTLEFMNAFLNGLAYLCIFSILLESSGGKVAEENLASLEREISNHFYIVKDVVKSDSQLKKLFGYLLDDVLAQYYEYGINCLVRVSNAFEAKHAEAKTKGFNGLQIAYLQEAVNLYKNMDKESFAAKKTLQKKFEPLKKKLDELILMNNEVFKAKVPPRSELNDIKPIETKVRPLEPKNIRVPPADAQYFSSFSCPEMENVKSSLNLFISNKKQHVEKTLFDLKDRMNEINKTYNIPYLKSLANLGEISPETERKLAAIREEGEKGFVTQLDRLAKSRQQIEDAFQGIDRLIQMENEKDSKAISASQNSNYATFTVAFADQIGKLGEIKNGFRTYSTIEQKCFAEFERFKPHLQKIANSGVSIKELVRNPEMEGFMSDNKEALTNLKKFSDGVEMLVSQHLKTDMENILTALREIDVEGSSQKVLMNETNLEAIYKSINEKLGPLVLAFEEKVTKVLTPMDKVKDAASKIPQPKVSQNQSNELLLAIDFFFVGQCLYRKLLQESTTSSASTTFCRLRSRRSRTLSKTLSLPETSTERR